MSNVSDQAKAAGYDKLLERHRSLQDELQIRTDERDSVREQLRRVQEKYERAVAAGRAFLTAYHDSSFQEEDEACEAFENALPEITDRKPRGDS